MRSDTNNEQASTGLSPIAGPGARILILGSLPGQRSLKDGEYYANPRNAFWSIMQALAGVSGDYPTRCRQLIAAGIAVWDVLHSSVRPGSLDADIRTESAVANDFQAFFIAHPGVRWVGLNGRKAEALYRRLVLPGLDSPSPTLLSLPSTSPAHAAMSFDKKLEIWRSMLVL